MPVGAGLQHIQARELQVGDTAGKGLAGLLEHIQTGRAEQQVAPGALAIAAGSVNQAAQKGEETRRTVHLVQDDQFVEVAF